MGRAAAPHASPDEIARYVFARGALAGVVHLALPGKRRAHTLLVANERTRRALPRGAAPRVLEVVENGVDMELFTARDRSGAPQDGPLKLLFLGRLVPLKGCLLYTSPSPRD